MNENIKQAMDILNKECRIWMVVFEEGDHTKVHNHCTNFEDLGVLSMMALQPIVDLLKSQNIDDEKIEMYLNRFVKECVFDTEENQEVD